MRWHVPRRGFAWSDTGESLPDYYERHARKASPRDRKLFTVLWQKRFVGGVSIFVFVVGAILAVKDDDGAGILEFLAIFAGMAVAQVAAFLLHTRVLLPRIERRLWQTTDTRQLR